MDMKKGLDDDRNESNHVFNYITGLWCNNFLLLPRLFIKEVFSFCLSRSQRETQGSEQQGFWAGLCGPLHSSFAVTGSCSVKAWESFTAVSQRVWNSLLSTLGRLFRQSKTKYPAINGKLECSNCLYSCHHQQQQQQQQQPALSEALSWGGSSTLRLYLGDGRTDLHVGEIPPASLSRGYALGVTTQARGARGLLGRWDREGLGYLDAAAQKPGLGQRAAGAAGLCSPGASLIHASRCWVCKAG